MLRSFFRLPAGRRALVVEAALALAAAQLTTRMVSSARLARHLGQRSERAPTEPPAEQLQMALEIGWSVAAAARHLPSRPRCLPQALAARWMLQRRHVPNTLFIGVARADAPVAHAWVRVGNLIVSGEREAAMHTVVSSFG